ncbi:MAG: biotin/lipoyl-binding protein, partial [Gemmatimonadota bacterium]
MGFSRRSLTILTAVIVLVGALGGIYVRLRALQAEDDPAVAGPEGTDLPDGESSGVFTTGVAIPVSGAPVLRDTLVMNISAAGQAQAFGRALLTAEVEGAVTDVFVREGQSVAAGEAIARIDPERYAFELEKARARL